MTVRTEQRFTKDRRCPICGGSGSDPRGKGRRCSGFVSSDGTFAHCSREEHAGGLSIEKGDTYAHRLTGTCRCGTTHGTDDRAWRDVEEVYDYRDERGMLLFQVVRLVGKSFRQRRPDGNGGWEWSLGDTRRVLYQLPALLAAPTDARVFVVEGEKDVETLRRLGAVATCNPMGAGKWHSVEECARTALAGRIVVIVADADKPGREHAAQVSSALATVAASVRTVELPKKDVTDWIEGGGTLAGLEQAAQESANVQRLEALGFKVIDAPPADRPAPESRAMPPLSDPEPLRRALPPAEPYPLDALGPILGPAARALHEIIQAPAALCAQSVLAAASLAAQPHANILIDGRRSPLTLWAITIGASGERKTAVDTVALSAHKAWEREQVEDHERKLKDHTAAKAAHEAAVDAAKRSAKSKNHGSLVEIRAAIDKCGDAPTAPPSPLLIVTEPTLEAVQKHYLTGAPSLGIFADEGAVFLGGHSMGKDHAMRTVGGLSKLWDDGTIDRVRSGDGAAKLYGRRLALHLMIQPVIAEKVLGDPLLAGQGFLARALVSWPESTVGCRSYISTDPSHTPGVRAFHSKICVLLRRSKPFRNPASGELDPPALGLTRDARDEYVKLCNQIEVSQLPGRRYSAIRPWASKGPEQALRIAGVLTIIENPDAREVDAPTMMRAGMLALYYLHEALRIVGTAAIPELTRNAEAIVAWCRSRSVDLVDSQTLLQRGPERIRDNVTLTAAMAELERTGWASPEHKTVIEGRRVRRAWRIRIDHDPTATPATPATNPGIDLPATQECSDGSDCSEGGHSTPIAEPIEVERDPWTWDDQDDEVGEVAL